MAQSTPSQPNADTGRPSTSSTTSRIRSRLLFSTVASLSAQVRASTSPLVRATASTSSAPRPRSCPRRSRPGPRRGTPARPRRGTRPGRGSPRAAAPRPGGPSRRRAAACRRRRAPARPRRPRRIPAGRRRSAASSPSGRSPSLHLGPLLAQHPQPDAGRGQPAWRRSAAVRRLVARPACRTSSTSRRHCRRRSVHGRTRPARRRPTSAPAAGQPQEVLDVARRARAAGSRRRRAAPGRAPRGRGRHLGERGDAQLRVAHHPARAQPLAVPTSNCGLTIGSSSPSAAGAGGQRGQHRAQRDERQVGDGEGHRAADGRPGSSARTLVRSCTRTRSSLRSRHTSCPYPTSTATTSAAPRSSSTSVNPPVDAPASRQRSPVTSTPNASSAPISLCAPAGRPLALARRAAR